MTDLAIGRRTLVTGALALGASRALADAPPIRLGCSLPQSGGLAAIGKAVLLTVQIWIDDINAKGGLLGRKVELVTYDDQSNPANVPRIYTKLLDVDNVDLIIANGTNLTVPVMPIAMERNKLVMAMFALGINDKFHYDRFFQTMPYGPDGKAAISEGFFNVAMTLTPKPTTVALVGADAEFSKTAVEGAREQAKRHGLKVVYDRTYPPTSVDFTPIIRGIASARPDLVYIGSYPIDTAGLIRAAHELNFHPRLFGGGMVGTQATSLKAELGPLLNGVVSYELYCPAAASHFPQVASLLARYQPRAAAAGVDPQGYYVPPFTYGSLEILAQAVTATGGLDQAKLAAYIHATTFKTIVGDIKFGADGEWSKPRMLTVQFRGVTGNDAAQFTRPETEVILDPPEYATGTVATPLSGARP
jgi:branched-chain amino acid transport system substrate-binding protein